MIKDITPMLGKTMESVTVSDEKDEMIFKSTDGDTFRFYHNQDCCESVSIEDIIGNLDDLVGSPLVMAEEATSDKRPEDLPVPEYHDDSETWTFYKFATVKGYVTVRWYGTSNGWYSESVDLYIEHADGAIGDWRG